MEMNNVYPTENELVKTRTILVSPRRKYIRVLAQNFFDKCITIWYKLHRGTQLFNLLSNFLPITVKIRMHTFFCLCYPISIPFLGNSNILLNLGVTVGNHSEKLALFPELTPLYCTNLSRCKSIAKGNYKSIKTIRSYISPFITHPQTQIQLHH